jgi:hypothetical protein
MRRNWNILDWNIKGINSQDRWNDIRLRSEESNCKNEFFDQSYIRNFCNRKFNQFAFVPSIGNSGGIITIWNGSLFDGYISIQNEYQITMEGLGSLLTVAIFLYVSMMDALGRKLSGK